MNHSNTIAAIPMKNIGPIKIMGSVLEAEVKVPLATFESPLWPSTNRGATVSRQCEGIRVTMLDDCMTRSILLEAPNAGYAQKVVSDLNNRKVELETVVQSTSRFAKLKNWNSQIIGKLIYLRFSLSTGDAAGHNMVTVAAEALQNSILKEYSELQYVSISGNYCSDKKNSAVNGILGRGKYMVAEICIPKAISEQYLKTSPSKIVQLNIKKNLIGSIVAGSVRSANAHFANMLLAFYLATGQDAANIVEGSQGIVHAELMGEDLYFSVTLPNIILGTVGNGKTLDFVKENLQMMGCLEPRKPGENATRLAAIAAATVLCGELSLLAAQTNPFELMKSHLRLERLGQQNLVEQVEQVEHLEKVKEPC